MELKVIFWNVWLENQINGVGRTQLLLKELSNIISIYEPDVLGLNEVLKHNNENAPIILDFLESNGYKYNYFSNTSPFTSVWDIGSSISSKLPLKQVAEIELGKNITAEKKGHFNSPIKAISCKILLDTNHEVGLIVAHPINIKPSSLLHHFSHTKKLAKYIENSEFRKNSIIGGDFNEPMYLPSSFKSQTRNFLNHRTGSFISPTWRHNTWRFSIARANLDRLFWANDTFLELNKFEIIKTNISDHRPIYAKFITKN